MTAARIKHVFSQLRFIVSRQERPTVSDAGLLDHFLTQGEEAAVAELVRRHGPMVFGVCRRILGNVHDAEDAFQATFLVLIRKASSIRPGSCVGPWLHGVARRTALKARSSSARRRQVEQAVGREQPQVTAPATMGSEADPLIDEVISQLPEKYRTPLVLCLLEGKSRKEAASLLGWTEGTLSGRLARAKALLAGRLRLRGLAPAAILAASSFGAEVSASLVRSTATAAVSLAGHTVAGSITGSVITLMEEVLKTMWTLKLKPVLGVLILVAGFGFGAGVLAWNGAPPGQGPVTVKADAEVRNGERADRKAQPKYVIEPPDVLLLEYARGEITDPVRIGGTPLVRPDGTVSLGPLGTVHVAGLTLEEAHAAIARHLARHLDGFDRRKLTVDVKFSNSKFVYVIVENARGLDSVYRFPAARCETAVDALVDLNRTRPTFIGLGKKHIYVLRKAGEEGGSLVLPVDWKAITMEGSAVTNYPLKSGDRVHVRNTAFGRGKAVSDTPSLAQSSRPSEAEILKALPKTWRNAKVESIVVEAVTHRVEEPRTFPLVGRARLSHTHWKCTVYGDGGVEVVYLDRDHLIPCK